MPLPQQELLDHDFLHPERAAAAAASKAAAAAAVTGSQPHSNSAGAGAGLGSVVAGLAGGLNEEVLKAIVSQVKAAWCCDGDYSRQLKPWLE